MLKGYVITLFNGETHINGQVIFATINVFGTKTKNIWAFCSKKYMREIWLDQEQHMDGEKETRVMEGVEECHEPIK